MKFGPVPLDGAKGAILAHALQLPDGRLKKGHVLGADDLATIAGTGVDTLIVARLEADDVAENDAAEQIAHALCKAAGDAAGMRTEPAFTGRVNFYATCDGTLSVSRETLNRVNRIDPAITVATLADTEFVRDGRMIATVKIIPFAVDKASLQAVREVLADSQGFSVHAALPCKVGLIATMLPSLKASVMDKTSRLLNDRLKVLGSSLVREERIAHDEQALASALTAMKDEVDVLVVFGASAITDILDVIPAGLTSAGGDVERFGIPVDPGNLLMTGSLSRKPVIGAPGCARSPAENGFDWVLQRVVCGLPVGEDYVCGLGAGGLLMEIERPQPREG